MVSDRILATASCLFTELVTHKYDVLVLSSISICRIATKVFPKISPPHSSTIFVITSVSKTGKYIIDSNITLLQYFDNLLNHVFPMHLNTYLNILLTFTKYKYTVLSNFKHFVKPLCYFHFIFPKIISQIMPNIPEDWYTVWSPVKPPSLFLIKNYFLDIVKVENVKR